MEENNTTSICQACGEQYSYVMRPGFPRKYCPSCSAIKKASYEGRGNVPAVPKFAQGEPERDFVKPVSREKSREHSIVAQVFTKCANEQLVEFMSKTGEAELEDFNGEAFLKASVNELHAAYKHALGLLEA